METLQVNENQLKKLATILKNSRIRMFEYIVDEDKLVVYDDKLHVNRVVTGYIDYIDHKSKIHPDDREKVKQIYIEAKEGSVEIREFESDGSLKRTLLELTKSKDEKTGKMILVGSAKDITEQKEQEKQLKEQVTKDPLTGVYNQVYGKMLINKYLNSKNPFESCGMIILDVDYFKSVNDHYGHLFGDKVLLGLCGLFKELFYEKNNIIMRAGGDEFVIFTANISNIELVRKNVQLMQAVRKIRFDENDCRITCSAGVCYLPENTSGYSYDQLFENADIALYKAKERGRNCYVYCDSLQQFTMMSTEHEEYEEELDARYFQNDIVATAFEIFEKTSNFDAAINLLMKVIGIRVGLDRITVIQADIKNQEVHSDYQWNRNGIPKVLKGIGKFEKQDFLILFDGYGKNGVNVLQYDDMGAYSPDAQKLLMQGDAKTVVYAAMYCEGRYIGAIFYVVCKEKRNWSNEMLKQLSEVTKIISAHFAKNETQVLVSTTVIEVGINVPNATVILIEDAQRFGLAQLHQLRGRVGRGDAQSYCIMIDTSGKEESAKRLEVLNHSNDGFAIANEDLKLRGPGDFFGIRQSGEIAFAVADIYQDAQLLKWAKEAADSAQVMAAVETHSI